jgi:hypothetical protein
MFPNRLNRNPVGPRFRVNFRELVNDLDGIHTCQRRHSGLEPESRNSAAWLDSGSGAGMTSHCLRDIMSAMPHVWIS